MLVEVTSEGGFLPYHLGIVSESLSKLPCSFKETITSGRVGAQIIPTGTFPFFVSVIKKWAGEGEAECHMPE